MVESIVVSDTRTDLRISVLGPLRAWRGEAQLDLGPIRQRALLAALVLRPDATVSQGELLDGVWGLEPPGTGDKVVPVYVYRLRKCLNAAHDPAEPVIVRDRGGYRFAGAGAAVDTTLLEEVAAEASAAEHAGELEAAVVTQARALDLFQGEPLAGLPGPYAAGERFRLAERKIALMQEKLEWQLRLGWHTETVGELSALAPVHPHSEPLCALLMRALYGSGRRADALAAFTRLRRRLVDDLGVEPGEELRQVHQAVLREDDLRLGIASHADLRSDRRSDRASDRRAGRPLDRALDRRPARRAHDELPVDVGVLSGRDQELASLTALGVPRLISVDGVAGAGKTALAVRAAHLLRDRYEDGCLFVELHAHSEDGWPPSPQHTLRRLLRTVGAGQADLDDPGDLDELAARWRAATAELRLLLVLDDAAGAEQVRPLLPGGKGSTVLVTSRRRLAGLDVDVDRRVTIGPIDLDAAEGMLSRIVGEPRAARERGAVRTLARLCGRLPLALRIAAARLQNRPAWTVEYLVGRLADDEDRLGELTAEDRSVESAFHHSYERLPAAEQRAFRALGLAPAVELDRLALAAMLGCTARAAERSLENLVDASLLQQPVAGRYRLHDLVAVYARRLSEDEPGDEAAEARDGVLRLFLAAARCASDQGLSGFPTGPSGLDAAGDVPFTGRREAAAWLNASVDRLPDVVAHAAESGQIDYACWIAEALVDHLTLQGRYEECRAAIDAALPHVNDCTDRRMVSSLRIALGVTCGLQGRVEQARAWFKDALQISRRAGDQHEQARALGNLGAVECAAGRYLEAAERLTEVLHLAGRLGDDWLSGAAVCDFGVIHHRLGRHEDALDCFARALTVAEKIGSPRLAGRTLYCSGGLHMDLGRQAEAAALLRQAAELAEQAGDVPLHATALTRLGMLEEVAESLDAALDVCVSSGFQRP